MNVAPVKAVDTRPIAEEDVRNPSGTTTTREFRITVDDETNFSTRKLCPFRHNYNEHPLMQLDRLEQLAELLYPLNECRFIVPSTTVSSPFGHDGQSPDGRSIAETFRRIEEPGSWIALYHIETDPAYKRFLWDVMGTVAHLVGRQESVFWMRGFIFISAPPSVTPFHIDRENNFWMQIKGRKTINVWDRTDRDVVAAKDVEDFIYQRSLANVRLQEEMIARSFEFDCGPGDGVYFPSTTPHMTRSDTRWVKPGDGVAISIGIDFYSDVTRRNAYVHSFNRVLRRLGLRPRLPGESDWLDRLKYPFGRSFVELWRRFRAYSPPPGF